MQADTEVSADGKGWRRSPEIRLTALLFVFAFFISGVPRVFTQNAAYSLFISAYGADAVPYAYIAQALCVPLAGWIYLVGEHRLKLKTVLIATLAIEVAALILARIGIYSGVKAVAAAMIIWSEIEFVLASLLLWGLANQLMTLRQGKKYFGLVIAGEPVATIICGVATPSLMKHLTTGDLFLLSAGAQLVGIFLVMYITSQFHPPADADHAEQEDSGQALSSESSRWWKDGYIVVMVAMIFMSQMVFYFIDETFYLSADHRFPVEADLNSFLGIFSAMTGGVSLVVSLFLSGPLMRRFGVRGGLLTLPLLLLVGSVAAVVTGEVNGVAAALFFVLTGNKLIDQSVRYTLDKTTSVTLYQPLPAGKRMKLQAMLESMVEPLSGGVAGLLLAFMLHQLHFTAIGVSAVVAVIVVAWLVLVAAQARGYTQILRTAIAGRQFVFDPNAEMSETVLAAIRQGLGSSHVGEVLYALDLLGKRPEGLSPRDVTPLFVHVEPAVRAEAARWFEEHSDGLHEDLIADYLTRETDPNVVSALVAALAACSGEHMIEQISHYLDAGSESERLGAYSGLIRHGGIEGVIMAGNRLITDIDSADPAQRGFAALVMRQVGSRLFYRPLKRLLDDTNDEVRSAALFAAGTIDAPALWPAIVENLKSARLVQPAVTAVAAIGDPLLGSLAVLFDDPVAKRVSRHAAVSCCGAIGTPAAAAWLMTRMEHPNRELRHAIFAALARCGYHARPDEIERVKAQIIAEISAVNWILKAWHDSLGSNEAQAMVTRALVEEVQNTNHAIFQLLGLILSDVNMHEAWLQFNLGGVTQRSYVLEMLDDGLENETKAMLLPLLEPDALKDKLAELNKQERGVPRLVGIDAVALDSDGHVGAWAPASALFALSEIGSSRASEVASTALDPGNPILKETAEWILQGSPEFGKERQMLLTIEKVLILRSVGIFANVRESSLTYVAQSLREITIAAGELLFAQGDFGDSLYVIVSGKLRVHIGNETLAVLGERQAVGEMAALDPEPRSASVTAVTDSLLLRMSSTSLEHLIADDVRVARGIIRELCNRIRVSNTSKEPAVAELEVA